MEAAYPQSPKAGHALGVALRLPYGRSELHLHRDTGSLTAIRCGLVELGPDLGAFPSNPEVVLI